MSRLPPEIPFPIQVRIKCRDYVKKIAVYKDRLAVQLPDRVIVYELNTDDAFDMHYRVSHKIQKKLTCNLLVVTTRNVILCQEKNLQLYGFNGAKVSLSGSCDASSGGGSHAAVAFNKTEHSGTTKPSDSQQKRHTLKYAICRLTLHSPGVSLHIQGRVTTPTQNPHLPSGYGCG